MTTKRIIHWLWVRADVYLHICPCRVGRWTSVEALELAGYNVCAKLMAWGDELVRDEE